MGAIVLASLVQLFLAHSLLTDPMSERVSFPKSLKPTEWQKSSIRCLDSQPHGTGFIDFTPRHLLFVFCVMGGLQSPSLCAMEQKRGEEKDKEKNCIVSLVLIQRLAVSSVAEIKV